MIGRYVSAVEIHLSYISFSFRFPLVPEPSIVENVHLTGGHVEAKRRWVVVLKEVERESALRRKLDGLGGACLAVAGCNNVAVTGLDGNIAEVLSDGWCVAVGGLLVRSRAELAATEATGTGESVVGGGQVLLLGEEEDNGALLSGVFGGDVEVED